MLILADCRDHDQTATAGDLDQLHSIVNIPLPHQICSVTRNRRRTDEQITNTPGHIVADRVVHSTRCRVLNFGWQWTVDVGMNHHVIGTKNLVAVLCNVGQQLLKVKLLGKGLGRV